MFSSCSKRAVSGFIVPLCFIVVLFGFELALGDLVNHQEPEKDVENEENLREEADGRVVGEFGFHRVFCC